MIGWPLLYAEEAAALGVRWPRGILLHGPPGVGKSAAVAAVAAEFGATLHLVTASTVFGAYTGARRAAAGSTIACRTGGKFHHSPCMQCCHSFGLMALLHQRIVPLLHIDVCDARCYMFVVCEPV